VTLHRNTENKLDEAFLARADGPGRRGIGPSQRWALVELPFRGGVPALPDFFTIMRYIRAFDTLRRLGRLSPADQLTAADLIAGRRLVHGGATYRIEAALPDNRNSLLRLLCSSIPKP